MPTEKPHIRLLGPITREAAPCAETRAAWSLLVRLAQAGDVPAFEQLIREHQGAVYVFAAALLRHSADAADVAQESLIKAFRKLKTYRFEAPLRTWLLQITRNTCTDRLRSRQARDEAARRYSRLYQPEPAPDPEARLWAQRDTERVHEALARIDPLFREVVILFDLQELSYKEVAQICGIPLGTVKSRLARGRDALRRALSEDRDPLGHVADRPSGEDESP